MTRLPTLLALGASVLVACDGTPADVELLGADAPPRLKAQIDRAGRPAVSTATIKTFAAAPAQTDRARDGYNAAIPVTWPNWEVDIAESLAILDALDGTCGNQLAADASDTRYATLAAVLADDQLYVRSTSGTCGTYLGLEAEIVGALDADQGGCGGRMLDEDVIERSYSVLAAGLLQGVDDGIASDDRQTSASFPFLAAP